MKRLISLTLSAALVFSLCIVGTRADTLPAELGHICTAEEWEMLCLVNEQRLEQGLVPYSIYPELQAAAHVRTQELVSLYSHDRPDGQPWYTAITEAGVGYRAAAENIAAGQTSPESVVSAWLNSEGHRNNILDARFLHAGMGHNAGGFLGTSWANLFMTDDCTITAIELSQPAAACTGNTVEELNLYVKATCSKHGTCYLPLLDGMCTGFDPASGKDQTVTVTYAGQTATLQLQSDKVPLDTSGADAWAVDWLNRADELGLLSSINRTGFTSNITRAQFADLSVRLAEQLTGTSISPADANTFTDTTDPAVLKAKSAGIASGYATDDGFAFRPENPITRQEICVMLANVITYAEQTGGQSELDRSETLNGSFPDAADVAGWASKAVTLMCNNGVMSGRGQGDAVFLTPESHTSLQEGITLAVKLYDLLK